MSRYLYLRVDTYLCKAPNRNFKTRFGMEGDDRRQTSNPAGHYFPAPLNLPSPTRSFKKSLSSSGRNTRYALSPDPRSNRAYLDTPTKRLSNIAQRSRLTPDNTCTQSKNQTLNVQGTRLSRQRLSPQGRYCTEVRWDTKEEGQDWKADRKQRTVHSQ